MNTANIIFVSSLAVIIAVLSFMLISANNDRTEAQTKLTVLYDSITHAPVTKDIKYVHDTIPAFEHKGRVKGIPDTEFVFVPTHDEIMTNVHYVDSLLALMATPFNTEIPLDSNSHLWIEALPQQKEFKYDYRQGPIVSAGEVITYTKTVTLPPRTIQENLWVNGMIGSGSNIGFGLSLGYRTIGIFGIAIVNQPAFYGIQTHFSLF